MTKLWWSFSPSIDELEELMEFRLTYNGELLGSTASASHKHEVRKQFHSQLKRLWKLRPELLDWSSPRTAPGRVDAQAKHYTFDATGRSYLEWLGDQHKYGNYRFAPLATAARRTLVSLDILFLRNGESGSLMESGDLDGRLKTLIDTLRIAGPDQERGKYLSPDLDEDPFFVLMEDDKLVGNISSDVLQNFRDTKDCRIVIRVSLRSYGSAQLNPPPLDRLKR